MGGYHRPRVAIGCNSERQRRLLCQLFESHGLDVVTMAALNDSSLAQLDHEGTDVLFVDVDEDIERNPEMLDMLMEHATVPVLFNDGVQGYLDSSKDDPAWQLKLVKKITLVAHHGMNNALWTGAPRARKIASVRVDADLPTMVGAIPGTQAALQVWVLGASAGGPQALKAFLAALPAELPMAFIVVQHIGSRFVSFLARRWTRHLH